MDRTITRPAAIKQTVNPTTIQASEPLSLDQVYARSYARLVRFLTVAGNDRQIAEEAAQEAFIQAHLKWRRIRHYEDPDAWIRRVAINRLRNSHRSGRRGRDALKRLAGIQPRQEESPSHHHPVDLDLQKALAQLSDRQRMAAALFYLEDLSVADTAAAMGISPGAVSRHLTRAREALRRELGRSNVGR